MSPEPKLWLIRHAQTEWSENGRHTGSTDIPLTEAGRERARSMRQRLTAVGFAAVLCSPLSRARETASLTGLGDHPLIRDDLVEYDYGEYEGLTTPQIREARPGWLLWRDGCPGGELPGDVGRRVDRVIEEVLGTDGPVAAVAHGHLLRILGARWLEQPAAFGGQLTLGTAAVCVLGFERGLRSVHAWNS